MKITNTIDLNHHCSWHVPDPDGHWGSPGLYGVVLMVMEVGEFLYSCN